MGKLNNFEIFLTNTGGVCHPGEALKGQVVLDATQPIDTKEIRIECRGVAKVFWVDTSVSQGMSEVQTSSHIDHHTEEEEYISANKVLWTGPLTKGTHMLDFVFSIPEGVPSSFDGEFGSIRYSLKVFIERSWRTDMNTRLFTVVAKRDLNDIVDAVEIAEASAEMKVSALFSPSGMCHAALRLDRKGFVPGEVIPLRFAIRNNTARDVQKVCIALRQITDYYAGTQDRRTERTVLKYKCDRVPAHTTLEKGEQKLRIPPELPAHLTGCGIMHITYQVVLKVKPSTLSLKCLRIPIDLIMGNIPLRDARAVPLAEHSRQFPGRHVIPLEHIAPAQTIWTSLPPPTYHEVMSSPVHSPSSPDSADLRMTSVRLHDDLLSPPPDYNPRPRASTNSSLLRASGR